MVRVQSVEVGVAIPFSLPPSPGIRATSPLCTISAEECRRLSRLRDPRPSPYPAPVGKTGPPSSPGGVDEILRRLESKVANAEHLKLLKRGVDSWNAWRRENPGVEPDLYEAGQSVPGRNSAGPRSAGSSTSGACRVPPALKSLKSIRCRVQRLSPDQIVGRCPGHPTWDDETLRHRE